MMDENLTIILRGISLPYKAPAEEAIRTAESKLRKCGIRTDALSIYKRSVDARKKKDIRFVYSVAGKIHFQPNEGLLSKLDAAIFQAPAAIPLPGKEKLNGSVVVVGFGPCGMFAALTLAEAGYAPIVIERGDDIKRRRAQIAHFNLTGELDTESNVQFGAGGAGSFSDGKLITRIGDAMSTRVLETYVKHGAPESILTLAKPHVGTDKLFGITESIEARIKALGGQVHYRTKLLDMKYDLNGEVTEALTDKGGIPCGTIVLAIGHSARDTYQVLHRSGFILQPKDFSVGARIEHLQEDIDYAMYGDADISILGHAEYGLSCRNDGRGVYSFCMCPGGEVICASSVEGGIVVNGMSNYARDGKNANSAIAVSVLKNDYGADPMRAIAYQEEIERRAFLAAGGGYRAPIQTLGDFLNEKTGTAPKRILPSFRNGEHVTLCDLSKILPPHVTNLMREDFGVFEKQIKGFAAADAVLTGAETRTSAPLRILRDDSMTAIAHGNLYPCGEGAGYAGGITSAAVDGMRVAYAIIARYAQI